MSVFVIGVGRQESIRSVIAVGEAELRRTQGIPRQVTGRTDTVEFVAKRGAFKGDFETFVLSVLDTDKSVDAFKKTAGELGPVCLVTAEDGWVRVMCPPRGSNDYAGARAAMDALSRQIRIPEVWRFEGDKYRVDPVSVELIFQAMVQYKASDAHLSPGDPPIFRVDNQARRSELMEPLSGAQIMAVIKEISPEKDWEEFLVHKQSSFSFHQVGIGYARVSCFLKSGVPHLTFRYLPETIPSFEDLRIPTDTMVELAGLHRGLLLVTGMTGSGKTTTAAALVDWINTNKCLHILTIESPVEYVHRNKKSIISQRTMGIDVLTFNEGVYGALRHDPDVIVIGEMRDPDTIRSAINAAATGHLVISTLHANSASEVVNRIVSFFDPVERDLVKLQLRDCLKCVICQRLVPKRGGGRIPALEIMFNDIKPIADGIIDGDTDNIRIGMQQTVSHSFLFETYLMNLFKQGLIDVEVAREYATEVSVFNQMHMGTYSIPRLDSIKAGHH